MATRVFLLSADEKAVHVITQILDEQDIRFEHSSDATFTLKRLAGQHFDVLIVDCDNAESAMQVFNSARASHFNKGAIAVAIVEGKAGVPNAFRLGASLVLTKPVSLDQARNTLRTAVGMTKKDGTEARPMAAPATPPAAAPHASPPAHPAIPVPPVLSPAPIPVTASAPVAPPAPAPVPAPVFAATPIPAPVIAPAPSISITPALPTPVAPIVKATPAALSTPTPASPIPIVPSLQPVAPKPLESTTLKSTLTLSPSPAKESGTAEKTTPAPGLAPPKPALQLSETRIVTEPETPSAKTEKNANPEKSISLSSAMLESSASDAAIDKLETALSAPTSELKASSPLELFVPEKKEDGDSDLDDTSFELKDSAATLRAGAVPAFGGLAQQPFAGIEPREGHRGLLIFASVLGLAIAASAGAWFYSPGFQKTVQWEYSRVSELIQGAKSKPATSAVVKPPAPAPAITPAPVPTADPSVNAANNGSTTTVEAPASAVSAPASAAPSAAAANAANVAPTAPAQNTQTAKHQSTPAAAPSATTSPNSSAALLNASATAAPTAATKPADIFEVPEDYADDQVIHRVHPLYPNAARTRKLQGPVVLQAIINKQGKVDSLQLISGDPLLAQAAADAVKQWRYKPYSHNGDPVEFQTRVTVDFKLP